jgi:hypothetical protein
VEPLFDELVEIYRQHWDNNDLADALNELETAIIKIAKPKTVGDVMMFPDIGCLRMEGLIFLIRKDASDKYDEIEGYVEAVIMEGVESTIAPSEYEFDGWKLCEWIDQEYPQVESP